MTRKLAYFAVVCAIAVCVMAAAFFTANLTSWCQRGHPLPHRTLQLDEELISHIQSDLLNEQVRPLYQDVTSGNIIGKHSEDYSDALKQCHNKHETGQPTLRVIYSFTLVQALPPDAYDDGLAHGPMMHVVVCSECQRVISAFVQDFRF